MLNIQRFVCNSIQENCYVVNDSTGSCVIVDCGAYYEEEKAALKKYISDNDLKPEHLIVTHGHIDHNIGNKFVYDTYGLLPEVHEADEALMRSLPEQAKALLDINLQEDLPPVGKYLNEDDKINFGEHQFKIIATPGHTPGGVFFYCEKEHLAFSGDTLFHNSIGRTDFEGGSMFLLIQSLRQISQLPDETIILPGHGVDTTIGDELASNPYMDR
ncbi:MAG: MBL fold metallo-hydrolase [Prevotella sp.]|jgi:hydroxyacylglutathione hydrolase